MIIPLFVPNLVARPPIPPLLSQSLLANLFRLLWQTKDEQWPSLDPPTGEPSELQIQRRSDLIQRMLIWLWISFSPVAVLHPVPLRRPKWMATSPRMARLGLVLACFLMAMLVVPLLGLLPPRLLELKEPV